MQPKLDRDQEGNITRVWLSARTGKGIDLLRQALQEYFPELNEVQSLS
jgi:GTP-binding protein HflX